jgi:tetratricopeptide (TPR) repeat protein
VSHLEPELPAYQAFSRSLDEEWLRRRLQEIFPEGGRCPEPEELSAYASGLLGEESRRAIVVHLGECPDCAGLVREMERAAEMLEVSDPLSTARRGSTGVLRELLTFWPARLALAGAACAVLVLGLVLGWMLTGPRELRVTLLPPLPSYDARQLPSLGIGADVKPEADRRFRDAMALYGAPDFVRRALPLLREAVALDPEHELAQFWLGVALLREGRHGEAIAPLEAAVRLAPGSVIYKQYLAWAYLRTGATDKALVLQTELLKRP